MNKAPITKPDLKGFSGKSLEQLVQKLGKNRFHADQLFRWIYRNFESDINQMTNLSLSFRNQLAQDFVIEPLPIFKHSISRDKTQKFLFGNEQQNFETVLIPEDDRTTLCISSQIGCKMGCSFCATGAIGFRQNLDTASIVSQVWTINRIRFQANQRLITNVVFMGMGEPFDNFTAVIDAANILMDAQGFGISQRKVTLSTCGIVPKIDILPQHTNARLAISLHSPRDDIRNSLVPINKKYNLKSLITACNAYCRTTKKYITFEYTLLKNVNDQISDARLLVKLIHATPCKVNLIPYNASPGSLYETPTPETIREFQNYLLTKGVRTLLRTTRGSDIAAACGQLSGEYLTKGPPKNNFPFSNNDP